MVFAQVCAVIALCSSCIKSTLIAGFLGIADPVVWRKKAFKPGESKVKG